MKTLAVRRARGCMVMVMGRESPSAEDWMLHLPEMKAYVDMTSEPRYLVVTDGGAPYPEQRRTTLPAGGNAIAPRIRIAVITDSTFVHGVAQAQKRAMDSIEVFRTAEQDAALRYLGLTPEEGAEALRVAAALRAELRLPPRIG